MDSLRKASFLRKNIVKIIILLMAGNLIAAPVLALTPNDLFYDKQWYLPATFVDKAWNKTTGNRDIIVAVLDSGVDIDHPDLRENIWVNMDEIAGDGVDNDHNGYAEDGNGWDFVANVPDPRPKFDPEGVNLYSNHGTIVSGIVGARGNNSRGIAGVAWQVRIMPVRVMNGDGRGNFSDVSRGIDYAVNNGAKVINLSFSSIMECSEYQNFDKLYAECQAGEKTLKESVQKAYNAGVVIVAASGNGILNGVNLDKYSFYPICLFGDNGEDLVLGVGAINKDSVKSKFSNFGEKCVDIAAPGENIFSTDYKSMTISAPLDDIGYYLADNIGTSFAAPQVAGVAALIMSIRPDLSNKQIMNAMKEYGDDINRRQGDYFGKIGRRLNAERIIEMINVGYPLLKKVVIKK